MTDILKTYLIDVNNYDYAIFCAKFEICVGGGYMH